MVLAFVVFQVSRCVGLVSEAQFVEKRDSAFPVSCEHVSRARAVYVVLASCEVPHEIPPVHPVHLIVEEECEVLEECRLLVLGSGDSLAVLSYI